MGSALSIKIDRPESPKDSTGAILFYRQICKKGFLRGIHLSATQHTDMCEHTQICLYSHGNRAYLPGFAWSASHHLLGKVFSCGGSAGAQSKSADLSENHKLSLRIHPWGELPMEKQCSWAIHVISCSGFKAARLLSD